MPGAPVVLPPALTPVLNTLPRRTGEREVRSSALLLAVYPLFFLHTVSSPWRRDSLRVLVSPGN